MTDDILNRLKLQKQPTFCERHGALTAFVPEGVKAHCPMCVHELSEREQREQLRVERQEQLTRIACLPERFKAASFKAFNEHCPAVVDVKRQVGAYLRSLQDEPKQWAPLILAGAPGTGKTHALCALANNLIREGVGCHYTTMQTMLAEIKKAYGTDGMTEAGQVWKYVGNFTLLIIDEADVMRASENDLGLIFAVINGRYNELRSVALATNQKPEKLGEFLTERVADRLRENAQTLRFDWAGQRA